MPYDVIFDFDKQAGIRLWKSSSVPLLVRILRFFEHSPSTPPRPLPWYKRLKKSLERRKQLIGGGAAGLGIGALLTYLLMRRKNR